MLVRSMRKENTDAHTRIEGNIKSAVTDVKNDFNRRFDDLKGDFNRRFDDLKDYIKLSKKVKDE